MDTEDNKFNLWEQPWICVLTKKNQVVDVSLEEVLTNAHEYIDLAGDLPTQDFAILRLLLALLHTMFFRKSPEEPQEAWYELWSKKHFPNSPIAEYKKQWFDRFFLFDLDHPFYQEPNISVEEDKPKPIEKLNGEISESANKSRLFLLRTGSEKSSLSFAEAARWLVHNNCYDDTSLKNPSPKIGWCGQLWGIYAAGNNLFETLMLNLILWKDGDTPWKENKPFWEKENFEFVPSKEKKIDPYQVSIPDNPAELYTLQNRYVWLDRKEGKVISYQARSGVWFSNENAFSEQMTLWEKYEEKNNVIKYLPKGLKKGTDIANQIWREFSSIAAEKDQNNHMSGVVNWIASLRDYLGKDYFVRFRTVAIEYDLKKSSIDNVYSDSLNFHIDLLTSLGRKWRNIIYNEISRCKTIAEILGDFSDNIQMAVGIDDKDELNKQKEILCKQFYFQIDIPFRNWLNEINPNDDSQKKKETDLWHKVSIDIAKSCGKAVINEIGGGIWSNRIVEIKKGGKPTGKKLYYYIPRAYNLFKFKLDNIDRGGNNS